MLDYDELIDLEESIKAELDDNLLHILNLLNRNGQLEEALQLWGLDHLLNTDTGFHVYKTGKILVFGETKVKTNIFQAIVKELGIDKRRLELHLDYEDTKNYRFEKIKYDPKYSAIIFGPCPHSGKSKGDYESVISSIEHDGNYPPVIRLGCKEPISKTNFRNTLMRLIHDGVIKMDHETISA